MLIDGCNLSLIQTPRQALTSPAQAVFVHSHWEFLGVENVAGLARIIHKDSSRKRADAKRGGHSEA